MRARHPHEHTHRRLRESLISSFSEHRSDILSVGCPGVGSPGPPDDPTTVHLSQGDLSGAGRDEMHLEYERCGASARVVIYRFYSPDALGVFHFPGPVIRTCGPENEKSAAEETPGAIVPVKRGRGRPPGSRNKPKTNPGSPQQPARENN